ncbi:MAG: hypothetical protein CME65_07080 [Halobacteriovoraceae bacterium]|nr:hypothetical protein [Halobacteriovoraceae bacterium]|tara:strand:- start:3453 stop:3869 length:417 start_codon:yes stop_codon:yes gene_type:complete
MKYAWLILLVGCGHFHNQPIITSKAEHYVSPDKKIDVEVLVEPSNKHAPKSSMTRIVLKPGTKIPKHIHKMSDEYLYFVKGGGVLVIDGKKHLVKAGAVYYIPVGMKHSYENNSKNSAKAIQFYSPNGPEQRFKLWAD